MQEDNFIKVLRELKRERAKMAKNSDKSADFNATPKTRQRASETARECAIEIRRLEHEAHCLAVEMGIADIRPDDYYGPKEAPAGFGRSFTIHFRRPKGHEQH